MDYNRDRKSNISFSLHDSRILQIEINEDKLSLNMDRIFQYTDNEVKSFSGKELSFDEFKEQYPNVEFEIVTEDIADMIYRI